ncbi:hypothetical protein ISN44_As11g030230 [Arabidopsis suecica]|uniref:Uncharacterized protein n=1 Tax=Arabidopsis suecica TaxID=45249 RepID=A0A8T1ZDF1_ARASU|nr:hypothetical protein ISN44_As11g030230 [Arabidopsis suecica]
MVYLPQGILIDIVRRVGNHGFRELAPFIASGPDGKNAVFQPEVLIEVDLDEFIFVSSLANEGSIYRPFLMKCFEAGNITARYVEGLRRAVKLGPSNENLQLMRGREEYIPYAGERVMAQIADIEPPMSGNYDATFSFPRGDVPNCVHFACTMEDVCFDCIAYWYSRRVRQLC